MSLFKAFVEVIFTGGQIGIHYKAPLITGFFFFSSLSILHKTPSQIFAPDPLPNHHYRDCFLDIFERALWATIEDKV